MPRFKITYNAPVVLTFTLAAVAVFLLNQAAPATREWFVAEPHLHGAASYAGLVLHILGHANWQHLIGNFMFILLIGPILEERHGSLPLLLMILMTAAVTGLLYLAFSSTGLLGASGIVFMMILLASTANVRQGEIPLTFIAVAVVYLGGEVVSAIKSNDGIAHMAHLIGGASGAALGFLGARQKTSPAVKDVQAAKLPGAPSPRLPKKTSAG